MDCPQIYTNSYIKTHYNDASITEAAHIVKGDGKIVYEAEVNKKDILFDANGKFLKEVNEWADSDPHSKFAQNPTL